MASSQSDGERSVRKGLAYSVQNVQLISFFFVFQQPNLQFGRVGAEIASVYLHLLLDDGTGCGQTDACN